MLLASDSLHEGEVLKKKSVLEEIPSAFNTWILLSI